MWTFVSVLLGVLRDKAVRAVLPLRREDDTTTGPVTAGDSEASQLTCPACNDEVIGVVVGPAGFGVAVPCTCEISRDAWYQENPEEEP